MIFTPNFRLAHGACSGVNHVLLDPNVTDFVQKQKTLLTKAVKDNLLKSYKTAPNQLESKLPSIIVLDLKTCKRMTFLKQ